MRNLILTGFCFLPMVLWAADRHGDIYPAGQVSGEPTFVQEIHIEDLGGGKRQSTSTIKDKSGEIVMKEKALLNGHSVISQEIEQLQIGEVYQLDVKDGKVFFRTYKVVNGERQLAEPETSEKWNDTFITGPGAEAFLQKAIPALRDGQPVDALFGVFELGKGINFRFRKIASDDEKISIRMKPASFFISLLVSPIDLEFSAKDKTMIHYRGRTALRVKQNGKWKVFEAEIIYKNKP